MRISNELPCSNNKQIKKHKTNAADFELIKISNFILLFGTNTSISIRSIFEAPLVVSACVRYSADALCERRRHIDANVFGIELITQPADSKANAFHKLDSHWTN